MASLSEVQALAVELTGAQFVRQLGPVVLLEYPGDGVGALDKELKTIIASSDHDAKPIAYRLLLARVVEFPMVSPTSWVLNVGRAPANELVLDDGSVSKEHARVEHGNGRTEVTDVGSMNGTTLNGELLVPGTPYILTEGALIGFGEIRYAFYSSARLYLFLSGT